MNLIKFDKYRNYLFLRCLKYVAENAEEVMYTPSWTDLDQNILILIVQRDDLQVDLQIILHVYSSVDTCSNFKFRRFGMRLSCSVPF